MNQEEIRFRRFMIWLPFLVSIACVLIDLFSGATNAIYKNITFVTATRTIMGYIFPTIICFIITLICQGKSDTSSSLGIKKEFDFKAIVATILYGVAFIIYLIVNWFMLASIGIIIFTFVYMGIVYFVFVDTSIQIHSKVKNKI